jgi:hypothetical protein
MLVMILLQSVSFGDHPRDRQYNGQVLNIVRQGPSKRSADRFPCEAEGQAPLGAQHVEVLSGRIDRVMGNDRYRVENHTLRIEQLTNAIPLVIFCYFLYVYQ